MNKIKELKERFLSIISKKDERIETLSKENEQLKAEPKTNLTINVEEMKFPKNISVEPVEIKNFPEQKEAFTLVNVDELSEKIGKKFPEFPKKIEISNQKKVQEVSGKVEVENLPDKDYMPKWVPDIMGTFLKALIGGIDKITNKVFTFRLAPDERKKPYFVIPIDEFGKPIDFRPEVKIFNGGGGTSNSGGGSSGGTAESVKLKNTAGTEINPATETNQDEMISLMGDMIEALSNISIDAESVNLNTDQLETLIGETNTLIETLSGNIVDTLEHYKISDTDDDNDTKYYGFIDKTGAWYIMREVASTKTYRYFAGSSNYATGWTNRASHSYDYFNAIF